jgi:hypothetical protein
VTHDRRPIDDILDETDRILAEMKREPEQRRWRETRGRAFNQPASPRASTPTEPPRLAKVIPLEARRRP